MHSSIVQIDAASTILNIITWQCNILGLVDDETCANCSKDAWPWNHSQSFHCHPNKISFWWAKMGKCIPLPQYLNILITLCAMKHNSWNFQNILSHSNHIKTHWRQTYNLLVNWSALFFKYHTKHRAPVIPGLEGQWSLGSDKLKTVARTWGTLTIGSRV